MSDVPQTPGTQLALSIGSPNASPGAMALVPANRPGTSLLPGELPQEPNVYQPAAGTVLTVDQGLMRSLATRALAAGDGRLTAVGVAALQHGAGATTVARNLAICLATQFDKRVVLLEANQRSPSLRRIYALPDGPGLADVLSHRVTLGGALQIAGEHRRILMLPAAISQDAILGADALRDFISALLGHADAVVVDLAPVIPYRDTAAVCGALDGVALVLRGGESTVSDGQAAIERIEATGTRVLGAVLNRERAVVPGFLERLLGRKAA
jgi:Mrp family chromosome partitioning ATPase